MLSFIADKALLKSAARQISASVGKIWDGRVDYNHLIPFLLPLQEHWDTSILLDGSIRLAGYLNRYRDRPSHARVIEALVFAFEHRTYQELLPFHMSEACDLRKLFDIELPSSSLLEPGQEVRHPFVLALQRIPCLAPLRPFWNAAAVSTPERPFLPPLPPASCFGCRELRVFRFQNWGKPSSRNRIVQEGECGVILRDRADRFVGAVRWRWWGYPEVSGTDFSMVFNEDGKTRLLSFDLRPYEETPTCGPNILDLRDPDGRLGDTFTWCIEEIEGLSPRRAA